MAAGSLSSSFGVSVRLVVEFSLSLVRRACAASYGSRRISLLSAAGGGSQESMGALGELKVQAETLQDAFHFWLTAAVLQPNKHSVLEPPAQTTESDAPKQKDQTLSATAETTKKKPTKKKGVPEPLMHMSLHRVLLRARFDRFLPLRFGCSIPPPNDAGQTLLHRQGGSAAGRG